MRAVCGATAPPGDSCAPLHSDEEREEEGGGPRGAIARDRPSRGDGAGEVSLASCARTCAARYRRLLLLPHEARGSGTWRMKAL
ncbi:unnamed protein product [Lampetra planeri]